MTNIIYSGDVEVIQHVVRHRIRDIVTINVQGSKHDADPDLHDLVLLQCFWT